MTDTFAGKLDPAMQTRLDAHLDAIDQQLLAAGMPHGQRRQITQDVEGQVREMLRARSGAAPTLADLEAVLAELDPPEAYEAPATKAAPGGSPSQPLPIQPFEQRLNEMFFSGAMSLILAVAGWLVPGVFLLVVGAVISDSRVTPGYALPALMFFGLEIASLACGVITWRTPLGRAGAITAGVSLLLAALFCA